MEALAVVVQAVDVLDHFTLEVEDLEGLTVERAAQGEELLHELDDLAALGLHVVPVSRCVLQRTLRTVLTGATGFPCMNQQRGHVMNEEERIEKICEFVEDLESGCVPFHSKWSIWDTVKCVGHPVRLEWSPGYPHQEAVLWCYECDEPRGITQPQG